eukprot:TRINITY_DN30886_c0_g1_i2.p1 TRINITY_DN30886_c0_g1~~TRINITY_DN30886_c0_g1_i2.p1  ORF type:complete len:1002 (-),score=161.67 TRINITY_DN30886_c0_g1_i2:292-3297(-)
MEILSKAADVGRSFARNINTVFSCRRSICVIIENGTDVPLSVSDDPYGRPEISFTELPANHAGVVRFDDSAGDALGGLQLAVGSEFFVFGVCNTAMGQSFNMDVHKTKSRNAASYYKAMPSGFMGSESHKVAYVQGEEVGAAVTSVYIGTEIAVSVLLSPIFDGRIRRSFSRPGHAAFGPRFALRGASSARYLGLAEWCLTSDSPTTLGSAVFLMELEAAQDAMMDLSIADRLFSLDSLIHGFLINDVACIKPGCLKGVLDTWRSKVMPCLASDPTAQDPVYELYSMLRRDFTKMSQEQELDQKNLDLQAARCESHADASMVVLRTAALQCAAHLEEALVCAVQADRIDCVLDDGTPCARNGKRQSEAKMDYNSAQLYKHMSVKNEEHRADQKDVTKVKSSAAWEELVPHLVRCCISDASMFTLKRKKVLATLMSGLSSAEARASVAHYCKWVPCMMRTYECASEVLGNPAAHLFRKVQSSSKRQSRCCAFPCRRSNSKVPGHKPKNVSFVSEREEEITSRVTDIYRQADLSWEAFGSEVFDDLEDEAIVCVDATQVLQSLGRGSSAYIRMQTNSKSGEFFYFSSDRRFLVKTVSEKESMLLLSMLPAYRKHLRRLPRSLIVRYAGLFRMKISDVATVYFTVMANVWDTAYQVQETYDVKGSMHNRKKKEGESTGKDLDWISDGKRLDVPSTVLAEACALHEEDSRFLEEFQVMDYSVLIGIHKCEKQPSGTEFKAGWRDPDRGIMASSGGAIYFVGIIDFLISYHTMKKAEHLIHAIKGHGEDASCVDPHTYAKRQVRFVRDCVLTLNPPLSQPNNLMKAPAQSGEQVLGTRGAIIVSELHAFDLRNADVLGTSDPYIQASLGLQFLRSEVRWNTLNPCWSCVFNIPVDEVHMNMDLELQIWDEDNKALQGSADFLGLFQVPVTQLKFEGIVTLTKAQLSKASTGKMSARIQYIERESEPELPTVDDTTSAKEGALAQEETVGEARQTLWFDGVESILSI